MMQEIEREDSTKDNFTKEKTQKLNDQLFTDIGWGFQERNGTETHFHNYYSSVNLPSLNRKLKDQKVTVIAVFGDSLVVGLDNGEILQWSISALDGNHEDQNHNTEPIIYDSHLIHAGKYHTGEKGHTGSILAICYSKEFFKLVSASKESEHGGGNNLIVWDCEGQRSVLRMIRFPEEITCLIVTTVIESLAVFASTDRKIYVWDYLLDEKPKRYFCTDHTKTITSLGVLLPPALKDGKIGIISVGSDSLMIRHIVNDLKLKSFSFEKEHLKSISCLKIHFPYMEKSIVTDSTNTNRRPSVRTIEGIIGRSPILLTGSLDNSIIVWDYETATKIKQFIGHSGKITAIKVSDRDDDGSPPIVVSASNDRSIILWDLVLGNSIRTIKHAHPFITLAIQDATGLLIFSSDQHNLLVWDFRHTKRIKKVPSNSAINSIQVFHVHNSEKNIFEERFLIANEKGEICVRSWNRFKEPITESEPLKCNKDRITLAVIYQPNWKVDPIVITGDGKGIVSVWNISNQSSSATAATPSESALLTVQADQTVVSAISIYNPCLYGFKYYPDDPRSPTDIPGRKVDLSIPCVLTGGREKMIRIYGFTNKFENTALHTPTLFLINEVHSRHLLDVRSIEILHPTNKQHRPLFITAESYGTTPILWDLETLTVLKTFSEGFGHGFIEVYYPSASSSTNYCSMDCLNSAIVTGGIDGKVCIWNLLTADKLSSLQSKGEEAVTLQKSFQAHQQSITALLVYTPSGKVKPLLITGSIDRLIYVWDLFTREQLHILIGHFDRVNCFTVYDSSDTKLPVLISAGNDEQMLIWEDSLYPHAFMPLRETVRNAFHVDYQSKKTHHDDDGWPLMSTLEKRYGYSLFVENSQLFMIAVKYNRSEFLLKFFKYLVLTLPTMRPASIKKLTENHHRHQDLTEGTLSETESPLHSELATMRDNTITEEDKGDNDMSVDILKLAILKHDLLAVQTIVLAWLKNLNQDMESVLFQRLYHPMYYLSYEAVSDLVEHYPSEFQSLITTLQLVRTHESLLQGQQRASLTRAERMNYHSSDEKLNFYKDFWVPLFDPKQRIEIYNSHPVFHYRCIPIFIQNLVYSFYIGSLHGWEVLTEYFGDPIPKQPVTSLMIPFCTCKQLLTYLKWFVRVSDQLDDLHIFQSEVAIIMLQYFWIAYGRRAHTLLFLKYLLFLVTFLICMYSYEPRWHHRLVIILMNVFTLAWLVYYGCAEIIHIHHNLQKTNHKILSGIFKHFNDLWNLIDLVIVVCGIVGIVLRFSYHADTSTGRGFLAITSVSVWFKILYFLRPFSNTGPLVAMILLIAREIAVFLFILLCLVVGFAQGFWLLSNNDPTSDFGTVSQSLFNSFLFMIGQNVDPFFNGIASPYVATVLLIGFFLTMTLLMLNLLIALMGDVFSKARERGSALWRKEQAAIILEQSFLYTNDLQLKDYLLVLKYTSEVNSGNPIDHEKFLKKHHRQVGERITSVLHEKKH